MTDSAPKVSIGLPVYNGENYIRAALDCLLAQTFQDYEIIICDNCSTDQTPEICQEYAARDGRIHYHRNERNIGANANFNYVFPLAHGQYFKWAAHDDLLEPTYLERCVEVLDSDPSAVLCHSLTRLIDEQGQELHPPAVDDHVFTDDGRIIYLGMDSPARDFTSPRASVRFASIVMQTSWCFEIFGLIRAEMLRQTRLLDFFYGADKILLAELAVLGRFVILPEQLFLNRRHAEQSMSRFSVTDQLKWTNPNQDKRSGPSYRWLRLKGFMRAALGGQISLVERLRCFAVIFGYYARLKRWRNMLEEITGMRERRIRKTLEKAGTGVDDSASG